MLQKKRQKEASSKVSCPWLPYAFWFFYTNLEFSTKIFLGDKVTPNNMSGFGPTIFHAIPHLHVFLNVLILYKVRH